MSNEKVESVEARVRKVVSEQLDMDLDDVFVTSELKEDLDADDLAIVEITLALEEAFTIDITDEQVDAMVTVQDAVDVVTAALAKANAG